MIAAPRQRWLPVIATFGLIAIQPLLVPCVGFSEDSIVITGKAPVRGTIKSITKTEVVIETKSGDTKYPVNEVSWVRFDGEPDGMEGARKAVLSEGNYGRALDALKRIDAAGLSKNVKVDYDFLKAFATGRMTLESGGDRAGAEKSLREFVKANGNSYHVYRAAELLGELAAGDSRFAEAQKFFAALSKSPLPEYSLRGGLAEARMLMLQQNYDEALKRFDEVSANALTTQEAIEIKTIAAINRSQCLAETGKAAEALKFADDTIERTNEKDAKSGKVLARAYLAKGVALRKLNRNKEAILALLHIELLYPNEKEALAEALYHLSSLWAAVNKPDKSLEAAALLRERNAGSVWASRLQVRS